MNPYDDAGRPAATDSALLEEAGYDQSLKREFNFIQGAAVGFADMSPIVAIYGVFAITLAVAGPPMVWALVIAYLAMMAVALVFGEVASRYPLAGGVYQWTRQQVGVRVAWFAGWAYTWGNVIGLSAIAFGAASFFAATVGIDAPSTGALIVIALAFLTATTIANVISQKYLKVFVVISVLAEFVASIGVGTVLLIGYRENSLSVLFDPMTTGASFGSYVTGAWLAALAIMAYATLGFEATGAIAEEVRNPERRVPKAIVLVLGAIGTVTIYVSVALILANPDIRASMTGNVADPVAMTLSAHFGDEVTRPLLGMITLGFVASLLAVQTAVSRVVFSFARDRMLPGARFLAALTPQNRIPAQAVLVVGLIAAAVLLVNLGAERVFQTLISFVAGGFYVAFAFPVVAALYLHLRGKHRRGPFHLGAFSLPVTIAGALWLGLELVNLAWPRDIGLPWYQEWAVVLMLAALSALGWLAFRSITRARDREAAMSEASLAATEDVTV